MTAFISSDLEELEVNPRCYLTNNRHLPTANPHPPFTLLIAETSPPATRTGLLLLQRAQGAREREGEADVRCLAGREKRGRFESQAV